MNHQLAKQVGGDTSSSGPIAEDGPRMITAEEILAERREVLSAAGGGYFPHDFNSRLGVWVSCDCPKCRDYYDPTGEHSARYLNMEFPSWFNGQGEKPSFSSFSALSKQSYLAHMGPGFYIGNAKKPACLEDVMMVLSPPLPLRPKRILRIADNHDWEEFVLSEDKSSWTRRTYVKGRMVYYEEGENPPIPFALLPERLKELFD